MSHGIDYGAVSLETDLRSRERKDLLRFITCGSVAAGKSTLIRCLVDALRPIVEDKPAAFAAASKIVGRRANDLALGLLVDRLSAERAPGVAIDVVYRFFSTDKRTFVAADTQGHEQDTRNMVTAALTAELAIVVVDARKAVLPQTRRYSYLLSLLGIRQVLLAINKMDLVQYSRDTFARIEQEFREFAGRIDLSDVTCIPISAVSADNVVTPTGTMPWYQGPTLLQFLERVPVEDQIADRPFRLVVQRVDRFDMHSRGISGLIVSGTVARGTSVRVLPSGCQTSAARILIGQDEVDVASATQSATVILAEDLDVSRGDVLATSQAPPAVADQFEATILWMHESPMLPGRSYAMRIATKTVTATVTPLKYKVNANTLEHVAARKLELNDIGICGLKLDQPIAFEPYRENRDLGGFILIDPITNALLGAGLLKFALGRSENLKWQPLDINKTLRAEAKGQKPCVIWFTGLSGAGKTTIANLLERRLHALGRHTYLLDGDNVRHGLNQDLGFTDADRVENIRRVAEVARLMVDAGLIVLVSFISPFRAERRMARELVKAGEFFEVYVNTPLEVAEARDPKGLYRKARRGELKNFTGVDSPYESPEHPEIHIMTTQLNPEQAAEAILEEVIRAGVLEN